MSHLIKMRLTTSYLIVMILHFRLVGKGKETGNGQICHFANGCQPLELRLRYRALLGVRLFLMGNQEIVEKFS